MSTKYVFYSIIIKHFRVEGVLLEVGQGEGGRGGQIYIFIGLVYTSAGVGCCIEKIDYVFCFKIQWYAGVGWRRVLYIEV